MSVSLNPTNSSAKIHKAAERDPRTKRKRVEQAVSELTVSVNSPLKRRNVGRRPTLSRFKFIPESELWEMGNICREKFNLYVGLIPKIRGAQGAVSFTQHKAIKEFYDGSVHKNEAKLSEEANGIPHFPWFYGIGENKENGRPLIVMDKVGDINLFDFLRMEETNLYVVQMVFILKNILEGLKGLHARGIVHGDICASNVVYDQLNKQFSLVDLGSGKIHGESQASYTGTYEYSSPEFALGINANFSQDIWSLGCLLYTMAKKKYFFNAGIKDLQINGDLKEFDKWFFNESKIECEYKNFKKMYFLHLANLLEMQMIFGKFPQSMLDEIDKKNSTVHAKIKNDLISGKYSLQRKLPSFEELISDLPDTIKRLLRKMLSYESRVTATELLKDGAFQKNIGIRLHFNNELLNSNLVIITNFKDYDGRFYKATKTIKFSARSKKMCHHFHRSYNDKYEIRLLGANGKVLFERGNVTLIQGGLLEFN